MGPALLLCPSSAVQLLGQVAPSKTARIKVFCPSNECPKHLLDVRRRGHNAAFKFSKTHPPNAWRILAAAAVGNEVSLQEPITENAVEVVDSPETPEALVGSSSNGQETTQRRRSPSGRNIVVNAADVIPGATFPGKVTSIQSFGAFVDIGTFTNGLVHISRLSKAYVKNVEDVVKVGQEVKVEILNVDLQANRISLMLKGEEDEQEQAVPRTNRPPSNPKGATTTTPSTRNARRNASAAASKPSTKFKKGESLTGVVKNIIRTGVFLTLPDGNDGFLPASEVNLKGGIASLETQFEVGQELTVRVLRIDRGRIALTTKQEVDLAKINESLNKDLIGGATNPFVIAFRQNQLISSYLEEKQKLQDAAEGKADMSEAEVPASKEVVDEQSSVMVPEKEEVEAPLELKSDELETEVLAEEVVDSTVVPEKEETDVASESKNDDGLESEVPALEVVDSIVVREKEETEAASESKIDESESEVPAEEVVDSIVVPEKEETEAASESKIDESESEVPAEKVVDSIVVPEKEETEAASESKSDESESEVPAEEVVDSIVVPEKEETEAASESTFDESKPEVPAKEVVASVMVPEKQEIEAPSESKSDESEPEVPAMEVVDSIVVPEKEETEAASESKDDESESEVPAAKEVVDELSSTMVPEKEEIEARSDVEAMNSVGAELEGAVGDMVQDATESKADEIESDVPTNEVVDEQSSTMVPEKEETEAPSDLEVVNSESKVELEGEMVQGGVISAVSVKEGINEDLVVEEIEAAPAAKIVVDEPPH